MTVRHSLYGQQRPAAGIGTISAIVVITTTILLTAEACVEQPLEKALSTPSVPRAVSTSPSLERPVAEGKEGLLYATSGQMVYIGVDQEAAERAEAGDAATIQELVAAGRLFGVPNGTRVKFFAAGAAQRLGAEPTEVRILEGTQAGRSGWVLYEWIR